MFEVCLRYVLEGLENGPLGADFASYVFGLGMTGVDLADMFRGTQT